MSSETPISYKCREMEAPDYQCYKQGCTHIVRPFSLYCSCHKKKLDLRYRKDIKPKQLVANIKQMSKNFTKEEKHKIGLLALKMFKRKEESEQ